MLAEPTSQYIPLPVNEMSLAAAMEASELPYPLWPLHRTDTSRQDNSGSLWTCGNRQPLPLPSGVRRMGTGRGVRRMADPARLKPVAAGLLGLGWCPQALIGVWQALLWELRMATIHLPPCLSVKHMTRPVPVASRRSSSHAQSVLRARLSLAQIDTESLLTTDSD